MSNMIIRKAKQDYICDKCNHIIKSGTEYIDHVLLHDTKVVKHERFHDECPELDEAVLLLKKIIASEWELRVCDKENKEKYFATGVDSNMVVLVYTYDRDGEPLMVPFEQFKKDFYIFDERLESMF